MKKISAPMVVTALGIVAGLILIYFAVDRNKTPQYDNNEERRALAQCLTERGATMYGAYWCPHCDNQKAAFGPGVDDIDYVECSIQGQSRSVVVQACQDAGIESYPTWRLADGTLLRGEQSLTRLARETGCAYGDFAGTPEGVDLNPDEILLPAEEGVDNFSSPEEPSN